ncbi:MAG TPA: ATP phosphoribosyltransferase [Firmicutes bacterium]|nr:ATP phosphoribosyltransferase [Bacillota bacterium]
METKIERDSVILNIALPKGRLLPHIVPLLKSVGINCDEVTESSRRLVLMDERSNTRLFLMRPADVLTYVEQGACDVGIVGKDLILEERRDVCELVDLGFGFCRFVLAAPKEVAEKGLPGRGSIRVATKFPHIAGEYFQRKGIRAEIIKLHGSVELAPLAGLAEMIVDITSTGQTLAENNLVVLDEIATATARLVANRVSFRLKSERINSLVSKIQGTLARVQGTPTEAGEGDQNANLVGAGIS